MAKEPGRKPDYILGCIDKEADKRYNGIGVAWTESAGRIAIKLNDLVRLPTHGNFMLSLFPNRNWEKPVPPTPRTQSQPDLDDEIPF